MHFWILQTVLNASRCAALVRSERKEARSKKRVAGWVSCSCRLLPRVEYRLGTTLLILGNGKNSADFTRRKKALFFEGTAALLCFAFAVLHSASNGALDASVAAHIAENGPNQVFLRVPLRKLEESLYYKRQRYVRKPLLKSIKIIRQLFLSSKM